MAKIKIGDTQINLYRGSLHIGIPLYRDPYIGIPIYRDPLYIGIPTYRDPIIYRDQT